MRRKLPDNNDLIEELKQELADSEEVLQDAEQHLSELLTEETDTYFDSDEREAVIDFFTKLTGSNSEELFTILSAIHKVVSWRTLVISTKEEIADEQNKNVVPMQATT